MSLDSGLVRLNRLVRFEAGEGSLGDHGLILYGELAEPRQALVDVAAQWACGLVGATDVVNVMAQASVTGLESPHLAFLAGATRADADDEVAEHLAAAMEEVGLPYFGPGDPRTSLLAVAALAREQVHGRLPARDFCRIVHERFGHDAHDLIEPLAGLDDAFDTVTFFTDRAEQEVELERQVLDAARRIIDG